MANLSSLSHFMQKIAEELPSTVFLEGWGAREKEDGTIEIYTYMNETLFSVENTDEGVKTAKGLICLIFG